MSARGGLQRNNLDKDELNTMNRLSGALSLNYQISPRIVSTVNYSNFSTVVNFRTPEQQFNQVTPYDNLDTLNYRQISQNASLGLNFILGESKERRQNLNMNVAYQQSADEQGGEALNTGSQFYNFNSSYSMNLQPQALTLSLSGNANVSESPTTQNLIYGPALSVRKSLRDNKVSLTGTLSYNNSQANGVLASRVVNLRMGANYVLLEKHQFNLNVTAVNRFSPQNETQQRYREYVAELGYNYNFNIK